MKEMTVERIVTAGANTINKEDFSSTGFSFQLLWSGQESGTHTHVDYSLTLLLLLHPVTLLTISTSVVPGE